MYKFDEDQKDQKDKFKKTKIWLRKLLLASLMGRWLETEVGKIETDVFCEIASKIFNEIYVKAEYLANKHSLY